MKKNLSKILDRYKKMPNAAKAGLWFVICSIIQKSFSLITTPIFTRLLTTEQYGQYSVYMTWLQVFTIICTLRLDFGVFNKGMSKYKEQKNEYTCTMQTSTTIITLGIMILYLLFHKWINQLTELTTFVTLLIFAEVLFLSAMNFWMLRQRYDFKYIGVIITVVGMSIANLILGLVAVFTAEDKGLGRILSCVLVQICFGMVFYVINIKRSKKIYVKEFLSFALIFNIPLIPHYFSSYILEQSDRVMIQKMCGIQAVALYSVSYNAGMIVKIIINSINNALIPWQYRKLEEGEYKSISDNLYITTIGMMIILVLCVAFAPELIYILAGKQYMESIYVVPPVTLSMFFVFIYGIFCNVEFFYDANKFTMVVSLIAAGMNLFLNYLCIPIFGYIAAGYTTLICYIFLAIVHLIYVNRLCEKKTGKKELFRIDNFICLSIILGVLVLLLLSIYKITLLRYTLILITFFVLFIKREKIIRFGKLLKNGKL